jgi:hypothetical protein
MANGHGGKRAGAGRPKKALSEKILEGTTDKHRPKVLKFANPDDILGYECPEYYNYLFSTHIAAEFGIPAADDCHAETVAFLKKAGCLELVHPSLIVQHSILLTRWFECEQLISNNIYFIQNNLPLPNTMMGVALQYKKAVDAAWGEIWKIVAQNCEENYGGHNPQDAMMEKLLRRNMRTG